MNENLHSCYLLSIYFLNGIGDAIVIVLASSAIDRGVES